MSVKKPVKVITEEMVRKLIAKERKLWEAEKSLAQGLRDSEQVETAKIYGRCLTQQTRSYAHRQANCTHRKGGMILDLKSPGKYLGKGESSQYAIIKHQFTHGDIWVRCTRCGKWWKPPIRSQYKQDRDFWRAMFEYEEALNFPTNNTMSSSVQCKFHTNDREGRAVDGTEIVRERLANAAGY
jgi:hypothetical protein